MSELLAAVVRHACDHPRRVALSGDGGTIHYGEMPRMIDTRARTLRAHACRVIGLSLDNGADWILWDLAAISAGVVCVPLPLFFTPEQQRHAIVAAGIDHIVTHEGLVATAPTSGAVALPPGTDKVTFTSGTTGDPKGVCLPQAGLERVAQGIVDVLDARAPIRHLSVLPLGVLLENVAGVMAALLSGNHVIARPLAGLGFAAPFRPDFRRLLEVMHAEAVNTAILVPELLRGLVAAIEATGATLPDLRFLAVGGAGVGPALIGRARAAGLPVYEGYGLSECGSVVALNAPGADRPGSAGRLLPHVDAVVVDREIVVHNPVFTGYIGKVHSGPFATGDLGVIDQDDFVAIDGRKRNVIITSFGRNIAPEWIEHTLLDAPGIAQAFVYGDDLPAPRALIVPSSPAADIPAAIGQANRGLPEYAQVAAWHIVAPFTPGNGLMTANGRLRRAAIFSSFDHLIREETDHELLRPASH